MFQRNLLFLCESILLVIALAVVVAAQDETPLQVTNQNRSGDLPFSTSIGTGAEQVDVASGTLKIRIPIISIKGRGLDYKFMLRYDTAFWATATRFQTGTGYYQKWNIELRNYLSSAYPGLGWETNTPETSHAITTISCLPGSMRIYGHFIHTDSEGAKHPLFIQSGNDCVTAFGDTPEPDSSYAGISAQFGGDIFWPPITSADGTAFSPSGGLTFVNSNGNSQVYGTSSTDTLGRTIVTQQNGTNQILYKVHDSSGTLQTYTVNFVNSSVVTSFHVSGPYGTIQEGGSPARSLVSSIVLPNGRSYAFQYETGSYGGVTRIDLPTGAYVTYTWGTFSDQDRTHRYVTSRTVHVDGQSYTWNISRVCALMNGYCNKIQSTVTDPANNQSVYTSGSGDVTLAQIYQGSAVGTPLRQYAIDYQSGDSPNGDDIGGVPIRITTTLDNGQVSKKEFDYEWFTFTYTPCGGDSYGSCLPGQIGSTSRGNVNEIREYDWGSGAPGPLMRRTDNSYLHNSNSAYLTYNIVDKIISQTVYDGSGNQKAQTQYEYDNYVPSGADANPLLSTSAAAQHDYTHFSTSFIYRGNATRVKRWRDTDSALLTTTYQYDDLGNIRLIRDPLTHTTSYSYTDSFANSFCPPPTGKSGQAWVSQVTNPLGQLISVTRYPCTSLVQARKDQNDINASRTGTTYTYDLLGRATQKNLPDGGQQATTYNDVPPVSSTRTTKITATLNLVMTFIQDGLGRVRKTQLTSDPDGTTYTRVTYDGLGRKSQEWNSTRCDPDINQSSCAGEATFGFSIYNFDPLDRLTSIVQQDGGTIATTYSDNCTTVTDEAGKGRKSCADSLGRLTTVWEDPGAAPHLNYETDYQYDVLGNLLRVDQKGGDSNSANWRTRTFAYNSLSQLLCAANPEIAVVTCPNPDNGSYTAGTIRFAYDNDGNLLTKVSPAPNQNNPSVTQTNSYCYDQLHRVTGKAYSLQTCPLTTPAATYFYDQSSYNGLTIGNGIGKRTGMSDASGATAWSYDITSGVGWKTTEARTINGVTRNIAIQDSLGGSLASEVYPSGRTVTYTLGGAGRALEAKDVANSINYVTAASYAPIGDLYRFTSGSSISGAMTYNSRLQPLQVYFTTGTISSGTLTQLQQSTCPTTTATIKSRSYNFGLGTNDNGDALSIVNCRDTNRTQNFEYDNLNRIWHAYTSGSNWGEAFTIDAWGNLTNKTQYLGKTQYEVLNVAPATVKNQLTGFGYDAAGNMTSNGGANYTYDAENRLATAGGVTYTYDGDGNRVKKSSGTLYWGAGPLAESDLTATTTSWKEYVFFGGKRVARRDASSSTVHYYFADHLGSHSVVTNATGACEQDIDYYAYGGVESDYCPILSQNYKFTGKERDAESNLDYFGARHYSSALSRFMTPDWAVKASSVPYAAFGDPQTLNLYAHVRNNPLAHADLDGHCIEDLCIAEAAAVFALYAYTTSPAGQQVIRNGLNALASTPGLIRNLAKSDDGNKTAPQPATTNTQNQSQAQSTPADPNQRNSDKEGAQDKKLSNKQVKNLEENTERSAHEIKEDALGTDKGLSKYDIYQNSDGDITVKPKGSSGTGEPTGYSTEDLKTPDPTPETPDPQPEVPDAKADDSH